ncbi:MAG: hypothetical protein PHX37_04075 [Eubacteriales bacterium]|nr:hypothetical protein [Eubacteriales bacterium]
MRKKPGDNPKIFYVKGHTGGKWSFKRVILTILIALGILAITGFIIIFIVYSV